MKKKLLISLVLLIAVAAVTAVVILVKPGVKAQSVPENSYFKDVKKLSQGKRPQCLPNDKNAQTAVEKIKTPDEINSFDLVLGTRIIDVPAGYTTTTVHSFDGRTATGTNSYTDKNQEKFVGDLKSFNYTAELDTKTNNWRLTSYVACNE